MEGRHPARRSRANAAVDTKTATKLLVGIFMTRL